MDNRRTIVLKDAEGFSKGVLENAELEKGKIIIDRVAGAYMQYGAYTSREFLFPAFSRLAVSWNADTPENTLIEVQCRVFAGEQWSTWFSFGKWATNYPRESRAIKKQDGQEIYNLTDEIYVDCPQGATVAQVKVSLFTNDEKVTPSLQLLCLSVRPIDWKKQEGSAVNNNIYMPIYLLKNSVSRRGFDMELPLVLLSLLNRRGADVLPRELSYGMLDYADMSCSNTSYAVAMVGACGYTSYQAYMDIKDLREQIREDHAVAVEISVQDGDEMKGKWFVLRGFSFENAGEKNLALLGDVRAETEEDFLLKMPFEIFSQQFTGRAIVVNRHVRGVSKRRPVRYLCTLEKTENAQEFFLNMRGLKIQFSPDFSGWVACTKPEDVVHATTAHKTFYTLSISENGAVLFPEELLTPSARYCIFVVDELGVTYIANLTVPAKV